MLDTEEEPKDVSALEARYASREPHSIDRPRMLSI